MNLSEQITQFFEAGVMELKIVKPEQLGGKYVVQATQVVRTDDEIGQMNVMHQAGALAIVNALEEIRRRVNFCNEQSRKVSLE